MSIKDTRAMVTAALEGSLDSVDYKEHPIFKVSVPTTCPGVSSDTILDPKSTWESDDKYNVAANKLADRFQDNIQKFDELTDEVLNAGPKAQK